MTRISLPFHNERRELRQAARDLCARYPVEYWEEHDREKMFPEDFRRDFCSAGFAGVLIPEEYGGGGGTIADMSAILEEIAAAGGGLNACAAAHIPLLCIPTLLAFGTEDQRREYLPRIANGDLFSTFGVTEPDAGTDTTQITTSARRDGEIYVLNGSKVWNSGALRGDKILVLARTGHPGDGERKGNGLTLFLTDLESPCITIRPIPKIGRNAVQSCEVFFDDHPVRECDIVGEIGRGFYHLLHSLNGERLLLASEALGMGRFALENATSYAATRVVFGRQIGMNQAVAHPLADGYLKLLAASEVVKRALEAFTAQGGEGVGTLANAAKYVATEAAFTCTNNAMQTFGGYSFARDYHIGRYWIESRLQLIAPVNNQMILNYIAERELKLPRSY